MTFFSEELAGSLATPSLEVEGENTVSEESKKGVGENRSESTGKKGETWGLRSVPTQRELEVLKRDYRIGEEVGARLALGDETARALAKGYVTARALPFDFSTAEGND